MLLDVRKNSADLSNLNTRVEEIATRVTTNELVLVNNKVVKIAMTRAIQKLVCTGFANWVLVDSWASLATKKIGYITAFHIAAFVLVFLTSRADQLFWYRVGRKTRARESLQTLVLGPCKFLGRASVLWCGCHLGSFTLGVGNTRF